MDKKIEKIPKLFAFDLDGTLLNSKKEITSATVNTLEEIVDSGAKVAFASGRLKSSIEQYLDRCRFPVSVLSLNGAAVYKDVQFNFAKVYDAPLDAPFADYLITHAQRNGITCNYYYNDKLYAENRDANRRWIDFYYQQTRTEYSLMDSLEPLSGNSPSKIIFVGSPELMEQQQHFFRKLWGERVYVCRTWDYYLEFLNPAANKGAGLASLAGSYNIVMEDVIAFGDAENDIPMLKAAGYSIAVQNAVDEAKSAAQRVSPRSNNEEVVPYEWGLLQGAPE